MTNFADDPLVNQANVKRQAGGISDMSVWRWLKKGILPQPIKINNRNYWRQSWVDQALARVSGLEQEGA